MIRIKMTLSFLLMIFCLVGKAQKFESVLSDGSWYKMAITKGGIYKIDTDFLSSQNITIPDNQKIHIYGQRGGMLSEKISESSATDLVPLPLYEVNVSTGPLNENSAIYFYSEGPDTWKIEDKTIEYQKNIYSENNYVFFTFKSDETLKIQTRISLSNPEFLSDSYEEIQRLEEDKANPLGIFPTTHGSGQEWYGDEFSNLREKDYSTHFDFDNVLIEYPLQIRSEFVSRSDLPTSYELTIGENVITQNIGSVRTGDIEAIHARKAVVNEEVVISNERPGISINYHRVSSESKGWLDFIEVRFRSSLRLDGKPLIIRDPESQNFDSYGFRMSDAFGNVHVWDISNPLIPARIEIENNSWSYETEEKISTFVLFDLDQATVPDSDISAIANQNLHGIVDADMVIIYHKNWKDAAQRLAHHRSAYSELNVETIDVEEVYNEFSSGRQDPTAIRDFARMINNRSENFRYLLLFGDGSYDFRDIDQTTSFQSFVPTYETKESLDPLEAFPSDDYFAQLDDDEGTDLRGDLDIAVGRLPARNIEEAENFVNKIIAYDLSKSSFGKWRSRIAFSS